MEVDGSGYRRARKKAIKEGLEFLQSPLPFAGSDEEYKGYLHRLVCGLRDEGNQLYREGQALRAHELYSEALGVCAYMHDVEGFPSEAGVVEKLYVNHATCLLVMSQFNEALLDCEKALDINKMSHKALYRKAKALKAIGSPREAYEVAVQCSIINNDQEVFKLVQELAVSLGLRVRKAYVRTQNTAPINGITTSVGNGSLSEVSGKMPQEGTIDDIDMDDPLIYTDEDDPERAAAAAAAAPPRHDPRPSANGVPNGDEAPAGPAASGPPSPRPGPPSCSSDPYDDRCPGDVSDESSGDRAGGTPPGVDAEPAPAEPGGPAAGQRGVAFPVVPAPAAAHQQQQQQQQLHQVPAASCCGADGADGFVDKEASVAQHAVRMPTPLPILHQNLPPAFQPGLAVVGPVLPPGAEAPRPPGPDQRPPPPRPILVMPSFHVPTAGMSSQGHQMPISPFLQHGPCLQLLPHTMSLSAISIPPGFNIRPSIASARLSSGPGTVIANGPPLPQPPGGAGGPAAAEGPRAARDNKQALDSLDSFTDGAYPLSATRAKELTKEFGGQGGATSFGANVASKHPAVGASSRPLGATGPPPLLVAQPKKPDAASELFVQKMKRGDNAANVTAAVAAAAPATQPGDGFRQQRKLAERGPGPAPLLADGPQGERSVAPLPAPATQAGEQMAAARGDAALLSLVRNPLEGTHEFRQACHLCFVGIDNSARGSEHKCKKDLLLCRLKAGANKPWQKVRPRPMKSYSGVYMLCKDIVLGEECRFAGHCTFAYSQEEIDVWTQERKGTLNRNLLFDPFGGGGGGGAGGAGGDGAGFSAGENVAKAGEAADFSVAGVLRAHGGMFMFLCEECFDRRPRVISKRNKEALKYCTHNPPHVFDEKKCLVHILRGTSVRHLKVRPLHEMCQFDLCRHETRFGCNRQDSCYFAHDIIELKIWVLQSKNGLTQEDITQESKRFLQAQDASPAISTANQVAAKPPVPTKLPLQLKFVCSQCWKNGQVSEADRNLRYCEAKARHSWTKDRRALLAMSPQRRKWISVRAPPAMRVIPTHYEVCAHVLNGKKCFYIGNCNFAHSEEERDVWMYMKNNCLSDIDEVYKQWLERNRTTTTKDAEDGSSPAGKDGGSRISMPTDYAENSGRYCGLCGRNCNSEKQWRQHVASEKHREKVFEDERHWKFRFPTGQFTICERWLSGAGSCPDEECPYAHGSEELSEWGERRDATRAKLEAARCEGLLPVNETDFGKYSCLLD